MSQEMVATRTGKWKIKNLDTGDFLRSSDLYPRLGRSDTEASFNTEAGAEYAVKCLREEYAKAGRDLVDLEIVQD